MAIQETKIRLVRKKQEKTGDSSSFLFVLTNKINIRGLFNRAVGLQTQNQKQKQIKLLNIMVHRCAPHMWHITGGKNAWMLQD